MKNIAVIYWSGSGNTEEMANLIAKGAKEEGAEVKVLQVSSATVDDVKNADVVALGSPAMGDEVIEEGEMEPFVESISGSIAGKPLGLFGSYGWGSGDWMVSWVSRMNDYGANVLDEGLIINEFPDGEDADKCVEYGKKLGK